MTRVTLALFLLTTLNTASAQYSSPPMKPFRPEPSDRRDFSEIPLEPRVIDPATLVHPKLAVEKTVSFENSRLTDLANWLTQETGLPVIVDETELIKENLSVHDKYSDQLDDAPIYFLLNRLEMIGLGAVVQDNVIQITTEYEAESIIFSQTYLIGDLIDDGFEAGAILSTIESVTTGPWTNIDGSGGNLQILGDVMFVRQNQNGQREVAALLAGLKKHGLTTNILEPPEHERLRELLQEQVSVSFDRTPLFLVAEQLSEKAGIDIRLDNVGLTRKNLHSRDTLSMELENRRLETLFHFIENEKGISPMIKHGVMWLTVNFIADEVRIVVYDVSDLCGNQTEADALNGAITDQTKGPWVITDGKGGEIVFPKPQVMVISTDEDGHQEVQQLLAAYREALKLSKPREVEDKDSEVTTQFYKLDTNIAEVLVESLPDLIDEEIWNVENADDDEIGRIQLFPSKAEFRSSTGQGSTNSTSVLVPQSVLVITHQRRAHREIQYYIDRVTQGDPREAIGNGGYGGMGGGGFGGGGGFFMIPVEVTK